MKFLVISDTHGKTEIVQEIYNKIGDIDSIIHLGDYEKDAKYLESCLGCDVISVRGNMDGGYSKDDFKVLDTECGRILLTHGHMQNVKNSVQSLMYFAEEQGCSTVLFGHTHRALNADADGLRLINPGSITLPADGSRGTYAILTIEDGKLDVEIMEIEKSDVASGNNTSGGNSAPSKSKPKVQGGFIRDLLNNSDRF